MTEPDPPTSPVPAAGFATTRWSVILAAKDGDAPQAAAALETLCRTYWYPVYAFVLRRGLRPADAQDLTQEFFAHLLDHHVFQIADPARGRFRGFLLASLKNFLANDWDRVHAAKRGGGTPQIPFDELQARERFVGDSCAEAPPDAVYERHWALTLLQQVQQRLRQEYQDAGRLDRYEWLEPLLPRETSNPTYAELGERLGLSSAAIKSEVHRFRLRFRALLRREIAHTVPRLEEIDDEIRHLISVLAR